MSGWAGRRAMRMRGGWWCASSAALMLAAPAAAQIAAPADPGASVPTTAAAAAEPSSVADQGAQPATAQRTQEARRSYDPAFFATFAPATALDMVSRLPGFSLDSGNSGVRGFGQAAGNVVINGRRPSAKSDGIEDILQRIPASRVLRVEVATGDAFSAEYAGKSQVANVVLKPGDSIAGTVEVAARRDSRGGLWPEGNASALWKRGRSTFNAAVQAYNRPYGEDGYDRVTTLPDGVVTEFRDVRSRIHDPNGSLSGSWNFDDGANRTINLNGKIAVERFTNTRARHITTPDATRDDRLNQRQNPDSWELGGDVTRPLGGGAIKLTALVTRASNDYDDRSLDDVTRSGGAAQTVASHDGETLARVSWTHAAKEGWTIELGGEGALNRLQSRVDLFAIDDAGVRTRVDLPLDDAVVKEWRGEAFVNAGRALSPTVRVDLGMTAETSRLTVSGDAEAERTLTFLKPRAVLDWRPDKKWHVQATIDRTVSQLDFDDFISSAELSSDRVNGGNANLVPQRDVGVLVTAERTLLGTGLARVELGARRVDQVQDRVPTPDGYDAPGNLGTGTILIARGRVEAPLGTLGVKGGRVTLYGSYVDTRVRDPYTRDWRAFSGNSVFYGSAEFRQDLGKFAWGFSGGAATASIYFRRDELDRQRADPNIEAFGEWRPSKRMTLTLAAANLPDFGAYRDRRFFAPDRTAAEPFLREERVRKRHAVGYISLKRTFG